MKKYILVLPLIFIISFFIFLGLYIETNMNEFYKNKKKGKTMLRKFPYPYRAALSISNDADQTDSIEEFLIIQEYLNTNNITPLGKGLNLEIGCSFFGKGILGLLSNDDKEKNFIIDFIKLGYIDFIHSFNSSKNRDEHIEIIDILKANDCKIDVWVNHSSSKDNLGYPLGFNGDNVGSLDYHTDLSINKLGYQFFWQDAVSGIVGQGRPISIFSFFDSFNSQYPFSSFVNNNLSELAKYLLSIFGAERYRMRQSNELVEPTVLDDGQPLFEFMRSNASKDGNWANADSDGLSELINTEFLKKLIEVKGFSIIYTHLGKNNGFPYLGESAQNCLKELKYYNDNGNIYVTTTNKLLEYYVNTKYLNWSEEFHDDSLRIYINNITDPVRGSFVPSLDDLSGVTFYSENPYKTKVFVGGTEVSDLQLNGKDENSYYSVSVKINKLPNIDHKIKKYKNTFIKKNRID